MHKTSIKRFLLFFISLLIIIYFSPAQAYEMGDERIINFSSEISIHADASADIKETIRVMALQQQIRHGIYRFLITQFQDSAGKQHKISYQVRSLSRNSHRSPFHIQYLKKGMAIYAGSENLLLSPGIHIYTIHYHVENVVTFLEKEDEFYWNITGTFWQFPIEHVEATITLPSGANITHHSGYTGKLGAKGQDFSSSADGSNSINYITTGTLMPNEGLTVAIAWSKDIVHPATLLEQFTAVFIKNQGNFIALQTLLALLIYYGIIWYWEGRDPPPGTIIPLFEPPAGLSAAGMRFIYEMGFDLKTFTTAIVSLATRGFLTIEQAQGQYTLVKNPKQFGLSKAEKAFMNQLFSNDNSLKLSNDSALIVNKAKKALQTNLKVEFEDVYFSTHASYLVPGFILSMFALFATIYGSNIALDDSFLMTGLSLISIVCIYKSILNIGNSRDKASGALTSSNFMTSASNVLVFLVVFASSLAGVWFAVATQPLASIGLTLSILLINFVFYHLLKAHTAQGRKLMDQIEGFKLFLNTTEQERLDRLHPPEITPALFEKYLPYAMALGVENRWGEQFNQVLQSASTVNQDYQPIWFSGTWDNTNLAAFPGQLNSGLTFAVAISSIPIDKVSSSSGGGFSGGGGGGGGGGGW